VDPIDSALFPAEPAADCERTLAAGGPAPPAKVAKVILAAIAGGRAEAQLGWPERLFVRLNALMPRLVDRALVQQARVALDCSTGLSAEIKR
jgi:hypothetical protein